MFFFTKHLWEANDKPENIREPRDMTLIAWDTAQLNAVCKNALEFFTHTQMMSFKCEIIFTTITVHSFKLFYFFGWRKTMQSIFCEHHTTHTHNTHEYTCINWRFVEMLLAAWKLLWFDYSLLTFTYSIEIVSAKFDATSRRKQNTIAYTCDVYVLLLLIMSFFIFNSIRKSRAFSVFLVNCSVCSVFDLDVEMET